MDVIYLDNAATTPLLPAVWQAMQPYFLDHPGNPSSSHQVGRQARRALEDSREKIAHLLQAHPDEVLFTSGATEANNLALFGLAGDPPGLLFSSPIEHPTVLEPLQALAARGFETRLLPVRHSGEIEVPQTFPQETRLVSLMLANHETGAVQPVRNLTALIAGRAHCHCDAAAAAGKMPIAFHDLGVTSLTISAHKVHGPKGIGALLVRRQAKVRPILHGGHQQHGKRPGTEPVPLAVGMAAALELAVQHLEEHRRHVLQLRRCFLEVLRSGAVAPVVNGPQEARLPHILNVSFPGCRADVLLMALDLAGVACSTGSACSSGSLLPSPVLRAMEVAPENLQSAMRFSFSPLLNVDSVEDAARRILMQINILRSATPD